MSLPSEPMFLDDEHLNTATIDCQMPRDEMDESVHEEDGNAAIELANIMTTTSNPVSPGPSSPPLDTLHRPDFVPPTRPSSTPFPQPKNRSVDLRALSCAQDSMDLDDVEPAGMMALMAARPRESEGMSINDLPAEIQECILDHLFGFRVSPTSKSSIKRWGTALRHPRRKELSELSLVSRAWRVLIQERLYRHIKLKGTIKSLRDSLIYFTRHPHLRPYVKHFEIWFPVFQPRYGPQSTINTLPTVTPDGLTSASYILPHDNCTIEEACYFVGECFPEVCVLTLEGGERKKAPKVRHFISNSGERRLEMPKIETIRTLICKGQWNLIRDVDDFETIRSALPNLQEWHCSYSKPKSKSYLTMADILTKPMRLTTLNLCIEGDYRRELTFPNYFLKVSNKVHFCSKLAYAASSPTMENLSYTGRMCSSFFLELSARHTKDPRHSRLKTMDFTVKNCCRKVVAWNESGSGITDMNFINAFEALVLAAIRSLGKLKGVEYLRIRYVDLDSPVPPLNPYFLVENGVCSGVWNDTIVAEMNRVRPNIQFADLAESFGALGITKDGRMTISPDFPKSRAISLKLSNYALLSSSIAPATT